MQISGQVQVVQLPRLSDPTICPVTALRAVVLRNSLHADKPPFTVKQNSFVKVRSVLQCLVAEIGLVPSVLRYYTFHRSGACWDFDNNIDFNQIKVHGGWRSDAIWKYPIKTPSTAGTLA